MTDSLLPYGWNDGWSDAYRRWCDGSDAAEVLEPKPGRVIRHDGAGLIVATTQGPLRAMFGPAVVPAPVVGDWVVLDRMPNPRATLPRRSLLRRRAAGKHEREQAMAANVDLVLAVCGLDRPVRAGRIQRTVAIAQDAGAETVVVLTKADRAEAGVEAAARDAVAEADDALEVVILSAKGGWGLDDLERRIGPRTVALVGESGAGKSTLVNALVRAEVAIEGAVRGGDAKGRHTTTARELHLLPGGGVLVDTPGIREVGVWTDPDAVAETFPDIEELAGRCRFRDCAHRSEPGCAVRAALAEGTLDQDRFGRWETIEAEAAAADGRGERLERLRRSRQQGRTARESARLRDEDRNGPT